MRVNNLWSKEPYKSTLDESTTAVEAWWSQEGRHTVTSNLKLAHGLVHLLRVSYLLSRKAQQIFNLCPTKNFQSSACICQQGHLERTLNSHLHGLRILKGEKSSLV